MDYKIDASARCAVIGYGTWATALVDVLTKNESRVGWYVRNEEVLESLLSEGRNQRYLSDLELDAERIAPSNDLNKVISEADIIVMAMPSAFIKTFLEPLTVSLKDKFIISAVKGIVPGDYQTVVEYLHDHYDLSYKQMGLIPGPTHAEEVARERLSYLTVVCTDPDNAQLIGQKLSTKYIHLSYSQDLYGTEYAAILKNIYAETGVDTGAIMKITGSIGDRKRIDQAIRRFKNEAFPSIAVTVDFPAVPTTAINFRDESAEASA